MNSTRRPNLQLSLGHLQELAARSIHQCGMYSKKPFLPVDCSTFVPSLMASELFGHVRGAFTGAERSNTGLFESARDGTIFLDEIGDMPRELQSIFLRAIQEK